MVDCRLAISPFLYSIMAFGLAIGSSVFEDATAMEFVPLLMIFWKLSSLKYEKQ